MKKSPLRIILVMVVVYLVFAILMFFKTTYDIYQITNH